jgi:3-oxoacyl-[acyl-carrier protein] reductase
MNLSLKGKRAIVCGSTQGIGKSIAIKFAENGASVTLIARNENKLKNVINELSNINSNKHNYIVSDFNDIDILEKNFTDYLDKGFKPSILINNTGGPPPGEMSPASKKDFENYMA